MIDAAKLDELRALAERATPGEWEVRHESQIGVINLRKTGTGVEQRRFDVVAFTSFVTHRRDYRGGAEIKAEQEANAAFIVVARNLAPALVDEVKALRAIESAARAYRSEAMGGHASTCDYWRREEMNRCSCGIADKGDALDAVLAGRSS